MVLDNSLIIIISSPSGVGKTTMAAATAVWLADSGLRTLLISSDPAHSTSDSLETKLGSEPTPVQDVPNLEGLELDPEKSIETLMPMLSGAIGSSGLGALLGNDAVNEINDRFERWLDKMIDNETLQKLVLDDLYTTIVNLSKKFKINVN